MPLFCKQCDAWINGTGELCDRCIVEKEKDQLVGYTPDPRYASYPYKSMNRETLPPDVNYNVDGAHGALEVLLPDDFYGDHLTYLNTTTEATKLYRKGEMY